MPIYEYECANRRCKQIFEVYRPISEHNSLQICPHCSTSSAGYIAKRIISRFAHPNEDAAWIRSVTEVVEKDSTDPVTSEFRRDPTRQNMRRWMQHKGLRQLEPGEKPPKPDLDTTRIQKEVWEKYQKRNRIEIRSK